MTDQPILSADGRSLTITVPMVLGRRRGRKVIITPQIVETSRPSSGAVGNPLVKALARAHHWQRLLESGRYESLSDLARAQKINLSYLSRILRLTLLAPHFVEAILCGRQPRQLQLNDLLKPFPVEWQKQSLV
jgi:hypothetical protein